MRKYHQGKYKPKYPRKYKGDPTNIIYRSGWELKLFRKMDLHPQVEWWQSEEFSIKYRSPIDGNIHRYFPDVVFKRKNGGITVVEVKPLKETREPDINTSKDKRGNIKKSFLNEVKNWGVNSAKWEAAEAYCKKRGWQFVKMTEVELGIKK